MKIYKYPLEWRESQVLHTPATMKPLSLQVQHGVPTIWATVDEAANPKARHVRMLPTGAALSEAEGVYLGTLQIGHLVFHFYMEG